MTASRFIENKQVNGCCEFKKVPGELAGDKKGFQRFLSKTLEETQASSIYVDAFPAGIAGELVQGLFPAHIKLIHIARHLKWTAYKNRLSHHSLNFEKTYRVETLHPEQEAYLKTHSKHLEKLQLEYPVTKVDRIPSSFNASDKEKWLIVHSGSDEEIQILIQAAQKDAYLKNKKPLLLCLSPQTPENLPENSIHLNHYPASDFFPYADRIYSGGGFNSMEELKNYSKIHVPYPFDRKFDDQTQRIIGNRAFNI